MSKLSTIVDTSDGQAHVSTKSRWMGVIPMPHTGVLPYPCSAGEIKRVGTFIKWNTNDPATPANLHDAIVRLVQEIGASGLAGGSRQCEDDRGGLENIRRRRLWFAAGG
jgi:hypothetical protein